MQLFFKKPLLFEKIIISLHLSLISLVILNFAFFEILTLKSDKFQKKVTRKVIFCRKADLLVCNLGSYQNLNVGW